MKLWTVQIGGWLRNGKIDVDSVAVRDQLKRQADCEIVITIEPAQARRSNAANRYLWGVIYEEIHRYTEQPKEDIHDEMCARFTTETISYTNPATGEIVEFEVVRRTSGMTVSRFHKFVEDVKLFAAEFFGLTFEDAPEEYRKEAERAAARDAKRKENAA